MLSRFKVCFYFAPKSVQISEELQMIIDPLDYLKQGMVQKMIQNWKNR